MSIVGKIKDAIFGKKAVAPAARLRLFLEPAEDRGEQRVGALFRHRGRNSEFFRHRFDAAGLGQNIGQIHGSYSRCGADRTAPMSVSIAAAGIRRSRHLAVILNCIVLACDRATRLSVKRRGL